MKKGYAKVGVGKLCMLFGKTRHAYYDKSWHQTKITEDETIALEMVAEIRREMPRLGTTKLYYMLRKPFENMGVKIGRDALHQLLQQNNLVIKPKKRYVKTTDSNHWMKKYPNLIKNFVPVEPEQLWVSDITYIQVQDDFNFLSLITDAYSKRIMGHCLHPTLESLGCLSALEMAIEKRERLQTQLIHHSDRGSQYCCGEYVQLLIENNAHISMTEKGDPYENAIAERVNGILKNEFGLNRTFQSRQEAIEIVERTIAIYNEKRPHLSCNFLTPIKAHQMNGELQKHWTKRKFSANSEDSNSGFKRDIQDSIDKNNAGQNMSSTMPSYQDIPS